MPFFEKKEDFMPIIKGSSSITCRGRQNYAFRQRLCRRAPIGKQHQML